MKYLRATTYPQASEILELEGPHWTDRDMYQVWIRNATTGGTYAAFVSRKELAEVLWPQEPCPECFGKGWIWVRAKDDAFDKDLCPRCGHV